MILVIQVYVMREGVADYDFAALRFGGFDAIPRMPLAIFRLRFLLTNFTYFAFIAIFACDFRVNLFAITCPGTVFESDPFYAINSVDAIFAVNSIRDLAIERNSDRAVDEEDGANGPLAFIGLTFWDYSL